ncbi:NAD(P)-dependent dehydrogenase, short-chain alcohol dehydrogenase family [Sphingomonas palmae]|uniref:NAD(P)-dependent dehydrogenase, short-chain alcohol dehydrogenase family n=1 Tax=Sphingomonas palmae TaxID=1855283 RepID=A0A1H7IQY9_9SPHN|nr:SDR family oxidoreductase [Sphingomonas palmae]SEK64869.1 NAD(P)-dependent dehydrogenase, short-chain alcohol dehydrogenase family [Sphingomonas palmae]
MRVLVTGGAKRLGATIARAVAGAGHGVVIHYGTSRDEAEALASELGGSAIGGDLADTAALPDLFARAAAAGPIDGLVNSASLFEYDAADALDPVLAARLYAINCLAPATLTAALAAQGREGAVVNLLDQKLANPNPDFFSYTLSKYALGGATTMLAQAFAPRVRVNAVAPGLTLPSGDQSHAEFEKVASRNLLQHPVGARRVAEAVLFLLGAQSTTGQTLFVDAGQRFLARDRDVMFEDRDA